MTILRSRLAAPALVGPAYPPSRRRRQRPWALIMVAALVLGFLLLAGKPWAGLTGPDQLGGAVLAGPRPPGCLRIVVAADNSGSMAGIAGPRDSAVRQTLAWVPENLRADDEIAVVEFAASATVTLPPTSATRPAAPRPAALNLQGTSLAPLLTAVRELPPTGCRTVLLVIGDGGFFDLPRRAGEARRQLEEAGIYRIALLVPGRTFIGLRWRLLYPEAAPQRFEGEDTNDTAITIARQVAAFTGQHLTKQ